jgi:hypothetical protein
MDILVQSRDFVINLIYNFPVGLTSYVLRVGFLLALSSVALRASWKFLPWRTVFTQACVALLAITVSLYMPLGRCRAIGKEFLTLSVLIAFCCMIFLPDKLSFWLTPRLGNQLRLKKIIICAVWAGLVVQIIIWR